MLQARAIIYAIVVALFVALISAAFIQLAEMNRTLQTEQIEQNKLIRNLNSGNVLLLNTEGYDVSKTMDLYGQQEDSIYITKRAWGLFAVGTVTAWGRNGVTSDTLQKAYLLGSANNETLPSALYLSDFNTPLSITGSTLIVGNAVLPQTGIKTISIAGISYARTQLVYGEKQISRYGIPDIDKAIIQQLTTQSMEAGQRINSIPKKLEQSFTAPTVILEADSMYLDNCALKGNIHIKSTGTITIGANCQIEDVLITASKILIKTGFKGSLQAYAQDECIIEDNSTLFYPSVVGILRGGNSTQRAVLIVNKGCTIDGVLIAYQDGNYRQPIGVSLQQGSIVRGQVYVSGVLELKGTVQGNVTTDKFILRAGGGLYDNILMDGTIDRSQLSHFYIGPFLSKKNEHVGVVKYLQ